MNTIPTHSFRRLATIAAVLISTMLAVTGCHRTSTPIRATSDSAIIATVKWDTTYVREGLLLRQAAIDTLYGVPQHISILEVNPYHYGFDVIVNEPNMQTTQQAARSILATAAINGSYFDRKKGNSVCYLRRFNTVIDTTATNEWRLRVTGAIEIIDGSLDIIKWDKETESAFSSGISTVLASGPLLLSDGETCDFSACDSAFVYTKHPRSAIAETGYNGTWLITFDGRAAGKAEGVNIPEMAHFLRVSGIKSALNLDGGGSTTLWYKYAPDGGVVNRPCDNKQFDNAGEREVANVIAVIPTYNSPTELLIRR
ncbi:MAG: phosphodiester glycosidase family protein [Prevotellaceae bacterium]|nr:phosphodiester glycosidase family protein [Prevotellaceae bacterium]